MSTEEIGQEAVACLAPAVQEMGEKVGLRYRPDGRQTRTYVAWARHTFAKRRIAEWDLFENFVRDMGEAPPGVTLVVLDETKDAGPDNCKWMTRTEREALYRKDGRLLRLHGLAALARKAGLTYATVYQRVKRLGWTVERALATPKGERTTRTNGDDEKWRLR